MNQNHYNLAIAILCTVMFALFGFLNHSWIAWGMAVVAGASVVLHVCKLLYPNATWIKRAGYADPPVYQTFEERYQDKGSFTFDATGFTVLLGGKMIAVAWTAIESVLGYKADALTTDVICLEVHTATASQNIRITEETPGWHQFLHHLRAAFPEIDQSWEQETGLRPFTTDLTLLYDRQKRSLEEVMKRD